VLFLAFAYEANPLRSCKPKLTRKRSMPKNDDTRTEEDSLGPIDVPAEALYGAQTQRAKENFPISDLRFPRRFIEALGIVKQAAARANRELDLLDGDKAEAITESAREVAEGELDEHFVLDIFQTGSGTSTNMNANEVIANRASEKMGAARGSKHVHPNDDVNMSQSSNDVIPTSMHVAARRALHDELLPALRKLGEAFCEKADAFDDVVKSGRTHLMDATPVRLGQEFGGYAAQIRRGVRRLETTSDDLSEVALGGTATGTGLNRHTQFPEKAVAAISEITGLDFSETDDHFEAQAANDAIVSAHGAVNALASGLLKIANDLRHLSSGPTSGLSEITLPTIQPGSSIMPGKINPVQSEAMMMVATRVMGNHATITASNTHGNFELNVMMPVTAHALLQSISAMAGACEAFRSKCVEGIEANRERCRELLELNPSIATALNTAIGYDKASEVAKKAAKERKPVREVVREMDLLSDDELDDYLDARAMTEPGIPGE
jgi:fumarate hydratase class II